MLTIFGGGWKNSRPFFMGPSSRMLACTVAGCSFKAVVCLTCVPHQGRKGHIRAGDCLPT